ncbi:hypothetical protein, partial [Salmonella sp. s51228]|uniref:hypothetical protein n=1 Tax=Salmonella sp. s51228 TaxID=3159652 RepID=UPI0039803DBB
SALTNVIDHEERAAYNVQSDVFNIAPTEELCEYILAEMEENLSFNLDSRVPLHGLIVRHRWNLIKYCLNKKIMTHPEGVLIALDALHQDVAC